MPDKISLFLTNTIRFLGIDNSIAYTLFYRFWQLIAGFISVLIIAHSLSPIQQGFYYTFGSLLSLQIFFELGLTYVVLQFVSHEKAKLNWTEEGLLEGSPEAKARLSSLIRLSINWYAIASVLLVLVLVPCGLLFFGRSPDATSAQFWKSAWIWMTLVTSANLMLSPVFSVLEGCGLIAEVARIRLAQDLIFYPVMWLCLFAGAGLLSIPFAQSLRLLISSGWLYVRKRLFLKDQIKFRGAGIVIDWRREVWPMQWKIALSWLSGYFIFQLFNPVLFAYFGAVVAGQMGMTLTLTGVVTTIAMPWINTKIPVFGQLISNREYKSLDRLFFKSLKQAVWVATAGGILLFGAVIMLNVFKYSLSQRMLAPFPFVLFIIVAITNVAGFAQAAYLRAHKREPLLVQSLVNGVLLALSTFFLGRTFGATGMALGYFFLGSLLGLSWTTRIFITRRRQWHHLV